MITAPGLYIQTNPLRVLAVALAPTGQLAALEYPLTAEQAESLAAGLFRCAAQERDLIAAFDDEFLASANIFKGVHN